ncbi:hypothetical protein [Paraburkholderia terrae]|uniref:hypothetical protein n=1 Tax=Paraburkholderia terrae TaxID=311230 RepID=UPI001EE24BA4|nr:hypothetical protein [Paraburkholderia terrae]GJH02270.1 hypothetical protein CBA19C8_16955 [Paraburkholderia terrae]
MATITIKPFQLGIANNVQGSYAGGVQEQLGGAAVVYTGAGTITGISATTGIFRLYDGGNGAGSPLIAVDASKGMTLAPNLAFTRGVYIEADGPNSNISLTLATS